jgi:uncharacterized phage-associated protein
VTFQSEKNKVLRYTADHIANILIERELNEHSSVSKFKAQCLVFVSQGVSLALNRPLISGEFTAGCYCPQSDAVESLFEDSLFLREPALPSNCRLYMDPKGSMILDTVLNTYGQYSGIQLVSMTSQEGTPWHKTRKSQTIPEELISAYFKEKLYPRD